MAIQLQIGKLNSFGVLYVLYIKIFVHFPDPIYQALKVQTSCVGRYVHIQLTPHLYQYFQKNILLGIIPLLLHPTHFIHSWPLHHYGEGFKGQIPVVVPLLWILILFSTFSLFEPIP